MKWINTVNALLHALFFLCYAYQFFYIFVSLLKKPRQTFPAKANRYAVLIAARNEEAVIETLLTALRQQTYPEDLVDLYVVADNCTDRTAELAEASGATVFRRTDSTLRGKGYALQFLLNRIDRSLYDGFFVFDADNVPDERFIEEMNRTFSSGYPIVTGYRNSKNFGDNWISYGYALWFLRESRFLNDARMRLGTGCAVSGTGFLFSREVIEETDGWNFFLLTEDIEFTVHHLCNGKRIGYCGSAVLYDEQPVTFRQSWRQRMRWAKGYLQVFGVYGKDLLRGILSGSFSCYDMGMNILPAAVLSVFGLVFNLSALAAAAIGGFSLLPVLLSVLEGLGNTYLTFLFIGGITVLSEWKQIHTTARKKVLYLFSFPVFMLTYIPISLAALCKRRVEWKPIKHSRSLSLDQIRNNL